jgi:hypothetical protein
MTTRDQRDQFRPLSRALQQLHRALIEVSRTSYELANGPVRGSGELLQLVLHDKAFAWLQPLSGLIVEIDERSARDQAPSPGEVEELVTQVEALLSSRDPGAFGARYLALLGSDPHIAMNHFALRTALHDLVGD